MDIIRKDLLNIIDKAEHAHKVHLFMAPASDVDHFGMYRILDGQIAGTDVLAEIRFYSAAYKEHFESISPELVAWMAKRIIELEDQLNQKGAN